MGGFQCNISKIDESDRLEISLKDKSRNRNSIIDRDIIKIKNFNVISIFK